MHIPVVPPEAYNPVVAPDAFSDARRKIGLQAENAFYEEHGGAGALRVFRTVKAVKALSAAGPALWRLLMRVAQLLAWRAGRLADNAVSPSGGFGTMPEPQKARARQQTPKNVRATGSPEQVQ